MRPISIEGLTDDDILSLIYYMGGWENDVLNFFNSSELERLLRLFQDRLPNLRGVYLALTQLRGLFEVFSKFF